MTEKSFLRSCELVLWVLLALFVAGCSEFKVYEQPELFHPRTAASKSLFEQSLNGTVTITGPSEAMVPDTSGTYEVLIYDHSKGSGKPEIWTYPSQIGTIVTDAAKPSRLIIDRSKIKGLSKIEVWVKGRAADKLSPAEAMQKTLLARSVFSVAPARIDEPAEKIPALVRIQTTTLDPSVTNLYFVIAYYGKDQSNLLSLMSVRTDPPGIVTNIVATNNELRVEVDPSLLSEDHLSVEVEVQSSDFKGKSAEDKMKQGALVRQEITVRHSQTYPIAFQVASYHDTAQEFGKTFADCFYACEIQLSNPNSKPILLYSASLRVRVRYLLAMADVIKLVGNSAITHPEILSMTKDERGPISAYLDFKEQRRPMSYSDILAIFEYQKEGNPRQQTIDILKSAGEIAVAAGIFVSGPAYPKAVALFTGVFTRELEKRLLWDILLHAKNLQARSLQEIEEVAANGALHKMVFFPRRPIYGILPKVPVYISELGTADDDVRATITVITKNATLPTTPDVKK